MSPVTRTVTRSGPAVFTVNTSSLTLYAPAEPDSGRGIPGGCHSVATQEVDGVAEEACRERYVL